MAGGRRAWLLLAAAALDCAGGGGDLELLPTEVRPVVSESLGFLWAWPGGDWSMVQPVGERRVAVAANLGSLAACQFTAEQAPYADVREIIRTVAGTASHARIREYDVGGREGMEVTFVSRAGQRHRTRLVVRDQVAVTFDCFGATEDVTGEQLGVALDAVALTGDRFELPPASIVASGPGWRLDDRGFTSSLDGFRISRLPPLVARAGSALWSQSIFTDLRLDSMSPQLRVKVSAEPAGSLDPRAYARARLAHSGIELREEWQVRSRRSPGIEFEVVTSEVKGYAHHLAIARRGDRLVELSGTHPASLDRARLLFVELLESIESIPQSDAVPADPQRDRMFSKDAWRRGDLVASSARGFSWKLPPGAWRVIGSGDDDVRGAVVTVYDRRRGVRATLVVRPATGDLASEHRALADEVNMWSEPEEIEVDGRRAFRSVTTADTPDFPRRWILVTWLRGDTTFGAAFEIMPFVDRARELAGSVLAGLDVDARPVEEERRGPRYTNQRAGISMLLPGSLEDAEPLGEVPSGIFYKRFSGDGSFLELVEWPCDGQAMATRFRDFVGMVVNSIPVKTTRVASGDIEIAGRHGLVERRRGGDNEITFAGFAAGSTYVMLAISGTREDADRILDSIELLD